MNHNDIVRQSFKKQAEKFVAYHMSKVEYTDYLIQKIAATGEEACIRSSCREPVFVAGLWLLM